MDRQVRRNIREFLLTATPGELGRELEISLGRGDATRAACIRELLGEDTAPPATGNTAPTFDPAGFVEATARDAQSNSSGRGGHARRAVVGTVTDAWASLTRNQHKEVTRHLRRSMSPHAYSQAAPTPRGRFLHAVASRVRTLRHADLLADARLKVLDVIEDFRGGRLDACRVAFHDGGEWQRGAFVAFMDALEVGDCPFGRLSAYGRFNHFISLCVFGSPLPTGRPTSPEADDFIAEPLPAGYTNYDI